MKRIDPYGTRDVFDVLLAPIREPVRQLIANLVVDDAGNADPAGFGERFQACRDIDAIAKDVVAVGNHVAEIDTNAKPDALLLGQIGSAVKHAALHLGGTAHRVDDAGKFRQQPVARGFDDATMVLGDLGINQLPAMGLQALKCAFLVRAHQARIACYISGEDRGETAGRGHYSSGIPALRRPAK